MGLSFQFLIKGYLLPTQTPLLHSSFQFLIKGYHIVQTTHIWRATFNSSLKDTEEIKSEIKEIEKLFQFLIKGYDTESGVWKSGGYNLSIPH